MLAGEWAQEAREKSLVFHTQGWGKIIPEMVANWDMVELQEGARWAWENSSHDSLQGRCSVLAEGISRQRRRSHLLGGPWHEEDLDGLHVLLCRRA